MEISLPKRLRPSPMKTLVLIVVSALFTVAGFYIAAEEPLIGYLCSGFFGLGIVVFAINLHPKSAYLILTPEGFISCSLFRSQTVRWADVEEFSAVRISHNKMVAWDYADHYEAHALSRSLSAGIAGVQAALPDTYGMKAEALADLMNSLRRQYA